MLLYFISIFVLKVSSEVIVETTHGPIEGKVLKTLHKNSQYYGFMGVPYAAPPVKDLRFKPPQNIEPWREVLSAKKEKPACIQFNTNILKGQPIGIYGVEDCLYLDIFTPATDENKRPVIMFLYNQRFQNSYNKTRDYAPDFFIEEDVIVVTISHRLSAFGFLSLENANVPGNAGLRDIVAGLEWISKNIIKFGGDPKRITLLGSHAGAAAVDLLLHTRAKTFINSAILQSGTSLKPMYLQEKVVERAFKFGELLNITTKNKDKLVQELSEISPADIFSNELKASPDDYGKENQRSVLTFGPIVEKDPDGLLTIYPEQSMEKINIPLMVGLSSREGLANSLNYLLTPLNIRYLNKDFPLIMPLRLNYKFDPFEESYYEAVNEIKKFYYRTSQITEKSISNHIDYIGDVLTAYSVNKMVEKYSNSTSVYFYNFAYYSNLNEVKDNIRNLSKIVDGAWGPATGDELCYIFKCPKLKEKYKKHYRQGSEEMVIQSKMIKMWANFAKYGNPTPDEDNPLNTKWPPYSSNKEYLNIDTTIKVKNNLLRKRFEFWDRFIKTWATRAKGGVVGKWPQKDEL